MALEDCERHLRGRGNEPVGTVVVGSLKTDNERCGALEDPGLVIVPNGILSCEGGDAPGFCAPCECRISTKYGAVVLTDVTSGICSNVYVFTHVVIAGRSSVSGAVKIRTRHLDKLGGRRKMNYSLS